MAVGRGTLWLSVAAPPRTASEAVPIAAEHAAFCPDIEPEPEFEWRIEEPHSVVALLWPRQVPTPRH